MPVTRREFLGGAAGALLAAGCTGASIRQAPPRRPNILWIMTDQQPTSTLGCYGNPLGVTPHVDAVASEGVRFDRFYLGAFPCSPSRACFITGREAHGHGVVRNDVLLDDAVPTLGDLCRRAGYDTAWVGKWHLGGMMYRVAEGQAGGQGPHGGRWYYRRVDDPAAFRFEQAEGGFGEDTPQHGFQEWVGGWTHYHAYLREAGLGDLIGDPPRAGNHNDLPSGPDSTHAYSRLPEDHHMAAFLRQRAADFLRRRQGNATPFCLVVSFYGPHLPVAPPRPWDTRYALDQVRLPANHRDDLKGKPDRQRGNSHCYQLGRWTDEQFLDYIRRYYGYCAYLDHQVGLILKTLDETGQAQDTLVVYTSDHGDMIGAHGMIYKLGACGYEELLRVPFIVRYPRRLKGGRVTDALAGAVDALPTLLDLAGLEAPAGLQGRSFRAVLEGRQASFRDAVVCNTSENNLTIRDDRWKYVLNWSARDLDELYDLRADPGEMANLAYEPAHAADLARLRERLTRWLAETGHPYAATIIVAMASEPVRPVDARPSVTQFKDLGGGRFEWAYEWRMGDGPTMDTRYWSFCQFLKGNTIAFRHVQWPDKPTPEWKAGDVVRIGPVTIEAPADASGPYDVVIGLWEPKAKTAPRMVGASGNRHSVGRLTAKRAGGAVAALTFEPRAR